MNRIIIVIVIRLDHEIRGNEILPISIFYSCWEWVFTFNDTCSFIENISVSAKHLLLQLLSDGSETVFETANNSDYLVYF